MAGTDRSFQTMLNDYLTYDLLKEEFLKRDWLLTNIEKDNGWKSGPLPVPFKGAGASSIAFGSLTADNDVAEDVYVRGEVTEPKEVWGTMVFNHRDLMEHDGKVNEKSFLKILPDAIEDFMDYMKMCTSVNLLGGGHFAKLTANGTAGGIITVDHVDRFVLNQKVVLIDGDTAAANYYVIAIDTNLDQVTLSATKGGVAANVSAYTTAQSAKVYHPGAITLSFTSLKSCLLSATNGGSSSLYGQSKLAYPFLQAINIDGSSVTSSNILDKIFDAFTRIRTVGKGLANQVVMSYRNLGYVLAKLESSKGAYNIVQGSQSVSVYGWTEITIGGVKGSLKVVGIQEMDNDCIMFLDMRAMKFHSNGFFRKRIAPDGKHYYEVRSTSGYKYLVDICLFGELILNKPSYCGIMHSIP